MRIGIGTSLEESKKFLSVRPEELLAAEHGWSFIKPHMSNILNDFYRIPLIREMLGEIPSVDVNGLKNKQVAHWDNLFGSGENRLIENDLRRLGDAHQKHDVPLSLFIVSYGWFLDQFESTLSSLPPGAIDTREAMSAMRKLVFLDLATASSTYTAYILD